MIGVRKGLTEASLDTYHSRNTVFQGMHNSRYIIAYYNALVNRSMDRFKLVFYSYK